MVVCNDYRCLQGGLLFSAIKIILASISSIASDRRIVRRPSLFSTLILSLVYHSPTFVDYMKNVHSAISTYLLYVQDMITASSGPATAGNIF